MKRKLYLWTGLSAICLGLVALVLAYRGAAPPDANRTTAAAPAPSAPDSEPQEISPAQIPGPAQLPFAIQSTGRPSAENPSEVASEVPLPEVRELVSRLTQLDVSDGSIAKEAADEWKQSLRELVGKGALAVPAIREFLEQNQDLNFAAMPGGNLIGQSSLRTALLHTLAEINGPEATGLMLQTLVSTAMPSEIAFIAQELDRQYPGQYRQEALNAVNAALGMAADGQLTEWDIAPLFQVLQNYGGAGAVQALEQVGPQWKYYASLALAGLSNGEGVQSLLRQADAGPGPQGTQNDFAFQLLGQLATQNTDASSALLDQAKQGHISDSAWSKIASGLAGDQYGLIKPQADGGPDLPNVLGMKVYHVTSGNQTFYSEPFSASDAPDQADKRVSFIDQLLALNPSPAGVQALQAARTRLTGVLASAK